MEQKKQWNFGYGDNFMFGPSPLKLSDILEEAEPIETPKCHPPAPTCRGNNNCNKKGAK